MDVLALQGRTCSLRSSQRVGHRIRQGRARIPGQATVRYRSSSTQTTSGFSRSSIAPAELPDQQSAALVVLRSVTIYAPSRLTKTTTTWGAGDPRL